MHVIHIVQCVHLFHCLTQLMHMVIYFLDLLAMFQMKIV